MYYQVTDKIFTKEWIAEGNFTVLFLKTGLQVFLYEDILNS